MRWIYESYLNGMSAALIARELNRRNIAEMDGRPSWQECAVMYVLTNEKYIGDSRCQKKFTNSFPFTRRKNYGEREQYYVDRTHPAIITTETFERAQCLRKLRSDRKTRPNKKYPLTLKVYCGHCGSVCSRRVTATGRAYWVCRKHDRMASERPLGWTAESALYGAFTRMYNKLRANAQIVLEPAVAQLECLNETLTQNNPAMLEVNRAIAETNERLYKINRLAAKELLSGDILTEKLRDVSVRLTELRRQRRRILQNEDVESAECAVLKMIGLLRSGPEELTQFNDSLFAAMVKRVIVESESRVRIRLYGGVELPESLEAET